MSTTSLIQPNFYTKIQNQNYYLNVMLDKIKNSIKQVPTLNSHFDDNQTFLTKIAENDLQFLYSVGVYNQKITQRLELILHAKKCHVSTTCGITHCQIMKEILNHMSQCTDDACFKEHCLTTRRILLHWDSCKLSGCQVCKTIRDSSEQQMLQVEKASFEFRRIIISKLMEKLSSLNIIYQTEVSIQNLAMNIEYKIYNDAKNDEDYIEQTAEHLYNIKNYL
jgi:hypothetical protein